MLLILVVSKKVVLSLPLVRHYMKENSGTDEDAKGIFQEALITYYEKVVYDQLTLTSSLSTYLMGICKNLWR